MRFLIKKSSAAPVLVLYIYFKGIEVVLDYDSNRGVLVLVLI
jgi:hypothetical protein